MVAISMDSTTGARDMADHARASFPILSDPDADAIGRFGLHDLLGDGVAAPATMILDRNLQVLAGYIGQSIGDRVESAAIARLLGELNGKTRAESS